MFKDIIIVGLLWAAARFYWQIDLMEYYGALARIPIEQGIIIFSGGSFFALFLVLISYILRGLSCFALMKFFNKLFLEIGQFAICVVSLAALTFWIQSKTNVWLDLGMISLVPFEMVIASCYGLWLYDFNYPIGSNLVDNLILPILSILAVLAMVSIS